jgi:tetratricopeptide (TPR) repeat protein
MKNFLLFIAFVAICNCQGIFAQKTDNKEAEMDKAVDIFQKGKYKMAEKDFKKLIAKDPTMWPCYYYLSWINLYKDKEYNNSMKYINSAIKYAPNDNIIQGELHGMKGQIETFLGDTLKAMDEYNLAIKCSGDTFSYLGRGELYYAAKKYNKSNADFNQVLKVNPKSSNGLIGLGQNAFAIKDYNKALDYYNKAINYNPSYMHARALRIQCLYYLKRYREGINEIIYLSQRDDFPNYSFYTMDYWQLPEFEVAMIEQQRRDPKNGWGKMIMVSETNMYLHSTEKTGK